MPGSKLSKILKGVLFVIPAIVAFDACVPDNRVIRCFAGDKVFVLSSVSYGPFAEQINQSGQLMADSTGDYVYADMEAQYISRVSVGLRAVAIVDHQPYNLVIDNVSKEIGKERFRARLCFDEKVPKHLPERVLRLRMEPGEVSNTVRLPVGGFFRDTGGKWVFVLENNTSNRAVRRKITLGRKNSDFFEVLDGLEPGDQVITSTYEEFMERDSIVVSDYRRLN